MNDEKALGELVSYAIEFIAHHPIVDAATAEGFFKELDLHISEKVGDPKAILRLSVLELARAVLILSKIGTHEQDLHGKK